jgi:hypothetical protein
MRPWVLPPGPPRGGVILTLRTGPAAARKAISHGWSGPRLVRDPRSRLLELFDAGPLQELTSAHGAVSAGDSHPCCLPVLR